MINLGQLDHGQINGHDLNCISGVGSAKGSDNKHNDLRQCDIADSDNLRSKIMIISDRRNWKMGFGDQRDNEKGIQTRWHYSEGSI